MPQRRRPEGLEGAIDRHVSFGVRQLLDHFDREVAPALDEEVADEFRRAVKRTLNDVGDHIWSLVATVADGNLQMNRMYLDKLDEVHRMLVGDG